MSSANDMAQFLEYMVRVITSPSATEMYLRRSMFVDRIPVPLTLRAQGLQMKPEPILHVGYGMGFFVSYYKGKPY